jgi:hypothetical protein
MAKEGRIVMSIKILTQLATEDGQVLFLEKKRNTYRIVLASNRWTNRKVLAKIPADKHPGYIGGKNDALRLFSYHLSQLVTGEDKEACECCG